VGAGLGQSHDDLWWVKQLLRREELSITPPTLAATSNRNYRDMDGWRCASSPRRRHRLASPRGHTAGVERGLD
jgi:hypothetical protein